jgi:small-conductance mechanosensitive channel
MFDQIDWITNGLPPWLFQAGKLSLISGIAALFALAAHWLIFHLLHRLAKASRSESDELLLQRLARPTRYTFVALGLVLVASASPEFNEVWEDVAAFLIPALIGWIALAIMRALVEAMWLQADTSVVDNLDARRKRTRLALFSRIAGFIIVFVTIGMMLLAIPGVRNIGVTLVASAGLAGLAVGAAAQPALKSLIAGLQVALTEPINLDDVVIIDGEWGRIEDIRTTYVVVKIWDERRLIVPTSRFLDQSFENWTKQTSQLLGYVMLYLDPTADLNSLREEYERQIKAHRLWDKRVQIVQLTGTTPEAIEVRLLMSAKDSPTLFDLRCDIREAMVAWIRDNQPGAIVRRRLAAEGPVELRTEGRTAA